MLRILTTIALSLLSTTAIAQTAASPQPTAQQPTPQQSGAGVFVHQGVARDAVRFESQLKSLYPPQAAAQQAPAKKSVRPALEKALEKAAAANASADPRAGMRQYAETVQQNPNDTEAWLGLARALLAAKPDTSSGADRYDLPVQASAAAYLAYQRGRTTQVALDVAWTCPICARWNALG